MTPYRAFVQDGLHLLLTFMHILYASGKNNYGHKIDPCHGCQTWNREILHMYMKVLDKYLTDFEYCLLVSFMYANHKSFIQTSSVSTLSWSRWILCLSPEHWEWGGNTPWMVHQSFTRTHSHTHSHLGAISYSW